MRLMFAVALLILSTTIGSAQSSSRTIVTADGLIYLSGVVAAGDDVAAQTSRALDSVAATLDAHGSTLSQTAHVSVVLRNRSDMAALDTAFAKAWPTDPPARTTIAVDQPLTSAGALVELSVTAIPTGGERTVIQPSGWMKPAGTYSYGIKTGNTVFLTGLVSQSGMDNTSIPGDIAAQTATVMASATTILRDVDMTLADVVSSRVFLADAVTFQDMNNEYRTHFPASPPARATVKATLMDPAHAIELAMIAVKDPARQAIVPPNADGTPGRPNPNLSAAIQVGRRLYVAGMTGNTATNKGDVKAQAEEALARVGRALTAAGYSWADVVETTAFLPDMARMAEMDAAYRAVFPQEVPVRFVMGTPLMGADAIVEIMVTAVK